MRLCATDYQATYRVVIPFRLPYHSGSLIRGLLGRALRRAGCVAADGPCAGECARVPGCAYARLFDPPAPDPVPHRFLRGVARPPQPLLPMIPPPGQVDLRAGMPLELGVRVLGPLHQGEGDRLTAALEHLDSLPVGDDGGAIALERITQHGPRDRPLVGETTEAHIQRIQIVFETPAWLEQHDRLMTDLDFRAFFRAMYRRLTTLSALYGELSADDDAEFARLDPLAAAISTAERRLTPLQWERHSKERNVRHPMRGLLGAVAFEGPLDPFLPALRLAEATHIGKATSYGLGRIRIETQ